MKSLIFDVVIRILKPILWIVALWLLLRGHHAPGGGFIAGLVASSASILQVLSGGWDSLNTRIKNNLFELAGIGLATSIISGLLSFLIGNPFMTGRWGHIFGVEFGTPVLFDFGVFIVVFAVVLICVGLLLEEEELKT